MIHACFACLCVPEVTVDCSRSEGETTAGKAAEQPTDSRANAPQSKLPNVYQRGVPLFLHKPCCTHMYRPCTHLGTFFFRISPFLRVLDRKTNCPWIEISWRQGFISRLFGPCVRPVVALPCPAVHAFPVCCPFACIARCHLGALPPSALCVAHRPRRRPGILRRRRAALRRGRSMREVDVAAQPVLTASTHRWSGASSAQLSPPAPSWLLASNLHCRCPSQHGESFGDQWV
jgi:hypothetical protein